jgi:hypothetical protein
LFSGVNKVISSGLNDMSAVSSKCGCESHLFAIFSNPQGCATLASVLPVRAAEGLGMDSQTTGTRAASLGWLRAKGTEKRVSRTNYRTSSSKARCAALGFVVGSHTRTTEEHASSQGRHQPPVERSMYLRAVERSMYLGGDRARTNVTVKTWCRQWRASDPVLGLFVRYCLF